MDKELLLSLVAKHVDVPGLLGDILELVVKKKIEEVVQDSSNPYDDMLYAALYPLLEKELKEKAAELWEGLIKGE